jgi:hypothetical protein
VEGVGTPLPARYPIRGTFFGSSAAARWAEAMRATATIEVRIFALIELLVSNRSPTGNEPNGA